MSTDHYTAFDIETGSAERLYGPAPRPGWVKLVGYGPHVGPLLGPPAPGLATCTVNGNFFDFPALARHAGVPVERTIPYSRDLRVAAWQHDPPTTWQTKPGPGYKHYSMAALSERYLGVNGKSDLGKELAAEYGGWDHIDPRDSRLADYLRADLETTQQLNDAIPWHPYEQREAYVCTVTARATLNGFRTDTAGLEQRNRELQERAENGRTLLAERFGFPLTRADGKPSLAPQRSKAGKAAFEAALTSLGVVLTDWPRGKDKSLSLSKETLATVAQALEAAGHPALPVVQAVQEMNGIRNNAANVLRCVVREADGTDRVHPQFEPFQSSRRWSVTEPGLTVLKKGVADSERMFLIADGEEGSADEEVLVSIDLDQIDIRGAAAHAQDPALIALLNDPERDIHTEIAERSRQPRQKAKTLDLGWLYGRGAKAMAEMPGMDLATADAVCGYMAGAFPLVRTWQSRVREQGQAGILLDNGFGGTLRVDPQRAYTQAPALVGQSTTRELVAEGLVDMARRAPEVLPMLRMIVHDEVVASVPRRHAEEIARVIQSCLSRQWAPAGCSIPVNITAGQGKPFTFARRWGELYM